MYGHDEGLALPRLGANASKAFKALSAPGAQCAR